MILITAIFRLCYLVFLLYKVIVIVYMLKWAKTLKSLDWGVRPSYKLIFKISIWNIFKSIRFRFLIIPTIIYWTRPRKQSISINFKSKGFRLMSHSLSWMYLGLANMYKQLSKTGRIIELIIFYGMMKWIVWNCMLNRVDSYFNKLQVHDVSPVRLLVQLRPMPREFSRLLVNYVDVAQANRRLSYNVLKFHAYSINKRLFLTTAKLAGACPT